jgi:hypothetical protein
MHQITHRFLSVRHVRAAEEDEAIRKAIHEFNIFNPEEQKRLVVQRVD